LALNSQLKVIFNLLLWRPYSSAMTGSRSGDPSGYSVRMQAATHEQPMSPWLLMAGCDASVLEKELDRIAFSFLDLRS
jgi:hypothetical protein